MMFKNSPSWTLLLATLFAFSGGATALAASNSKGGGPKLAVSQGISSPAVTTPVNFSHGFLYANPAVATSFSGPFGSLEADTGNSNTDFGGELGLGNGSAGLAAGYYNHSNNNGRFGVLGAIGNGDISFGLGYHEGSTYSVGVIFQPKGTHRFGLAADFHGSGGGSTSIGAGYSYHAGQVIFALDAARRGASGNSAILLTPGLELIANMFALSVSYDLYIQDGRRRNNDQVWFGLGIGGEKLHFAVYHDYVNDWSAALTVWM